MSGMTPLATLLADQGGVAGRRQLLAAGLAPHDIRRLVRRRDLVPLHAGVYIGHTGEPTWLQRAWGAVLFSWPAALWGPSALRAAQGPGRRDADDEVVHVAIDRLRGSRVAPAGVRLHHVARLDAVASWNTSPPRMRYEEAALDVAILAPTELGAIAQLADACQSRRTTAVRLRTTLAERPRSARRALLDGVLRDVAEGTCSVLEHGYARLVERPHGFPSARRQARVSTGVGVVYRDVDYGPVVVELDGRLFHDTASARDRDAERDLDAAVAGATTVRLTWGQVYDRPCATAAKVARVLRAHGVPITPRPCGTACALVRPAA